MDTNIRNHDTNPNPNHDHPKERHTTESRATRILEGAERFGPYRPIVEAIVRAGRALAADYYSGRIIADRHKAPCDAEAERIVRAAIRAAFPDARIIGEELGREGAAGARMVWLVDPNDGTSAFSRGYRGSAVSVACLVDGQPEFAAVHAWGFPVEPGDLIVWRRGGPIVRNGTPVEAGRRPAARIVVSQSADVDLRSSALNAELCAPHPYLPLASIAYRLGAVACGDGVAGVSLASPTEWDLAAGTILLEVSGMAVHDRGGRRIRFGPTGRFAEDYDLDWVFGGDEALCRALAGKEGWEHLMDWGDRDKAGGDGSLFDLALPARPAGPVAPDLLDRTMGALAGLLSLPDRGGAGREGLLLAPPSGVALLTARSLDHHGRLDPEAVLRACRAHAAWLPGIHVDGGRIAGPAADEALLRSAAVLGVCAAGGRFREALGDVERLAAAFEGAAGDAHARLVAETFRDAVSGAAPRAELDRRLEDALSAAAGATVDAGGLAQVLGRCATGVWAMPREALLALLSTRPPLADGAAGAPRPPRDLWPCDALILAQRLAAEPQPTP